MIDHAKHVRTASVWNFIAGALMFFSPFLFGYSDSLAAATNSYIIGAIVFIIGLVKAFMPEKAEWLGWLNFIFGLWLIISPFALAIAATNALWTHIVLGLIIAILGATSAIETRKVAHA